MPLRPAWLCCPLLSLFILIFLVLQILLAFHHLHHHLLQIAIDLCLHGEERRTVNLDFVYKELPISETVPSC